jgi:GT2 family glycosyltransferase
MYSIAVLMTCYNRADTTLECLRRLFAQKVPEGYSFDVWLVDDGSPDKTGEKVKAAFPHVNVISSVGGLFWCKGMRRAWDSATAFRDYDFYMWLNDDTMLYDDAVDCLVSDYNLVSEDGTGEHVIVGSFTSTPDGSEISYGTTLKNGDRLVPNGSPQKVSGNLAGNCVLIHSSVFKQIGPIYGGYYHGFGDYDYALTMHKNKIPFYCASKINGWCKANYGVITLKGKSLRERLRLLSQPKGICLHDAILFRYRHGGVLRAILSCFHVIWVAVSGRK